MSRMSKFLKQTCVLEKALKNPNGSTKLDKFGEIMYDSPQTIKFWADGTFTPHYYRVLLIEEDE